MKKVYEESTFAGSFATFFGLLALAGVVSIIYFSKQLSENENGILYLVPCIILCSIFFAICLLGIVVSNIMEEIHKTKFEIFKNNNEKESVLMNGGN